MQQNQRYQPKSILITGGAGFVGSNVLKYFYDLYPNTHFRVLDILTYAGDIANIDESIRKGERFTFWYGDVCNDRIVNELVSKSEVVIHFAAETHVARSIYDDIKFFKTDVLGTQTIANAVLRNKKNIKKFIHISTSEVYGTAKTEKMSEDHPLSPQSPYAAAKTGADRLVYAYWMTHKIPAVIIRPFNLYGSNQHLEKLIPRFITSMVMNEPMTIHGTGESRRDFTYVTDLAYAIDLVVQAQPEIVNGEVFNVGNDRDISILEIAEAIKKDFPFIHGKDPNFTEYTLNIGDRPGQVFKHICDSSKIRNKLGWKPKVSFEEGLRKTIEWYVNNRHWWENKIWMRHVPIMTDDGKVELH